MRDGTPLGRYRLLELTSHGAVGDMWRAFDTVTQREVALRIPSTQDTVGAAAKGDASYPAYGPQTGVVVEYVVDYPLARPDDLGADQSTPNPPVLKRSRNGRWVALSSAAIVVIVATVVATILVAEVPRTQGFPVGIVDRGTRHQACQHRSAHWGLQGEHRSETHGQWNPQYGRRVGGVFGDVATASVCTPAGCVATASTGGWYPVADLVFDNVGQRWIAISTSRKQCGDRDDESFNAILLEPQPDGRPLG